MKHIHICYGCGLGKARYPWTLCPECYQKACEAGGEYRQQQVLKAKAVIANHTDGWIQPKPKLWLWGFSSRKEWLKQYWPECLIFGSLLLFWIGFLTFLIFQVVNSYSPVGGDSLHHSKLPIAGKDKE